MQSTVIVPLYKSQLVTLYRQGFNTIDSSRIIFVKLENNLPIIPEGILATVLPLFEEDFEVLLIEFDIIFSTRIIQNEIIIAPNLKLPLEISFEDIKRIYPLSERGAKSLNLGEAIKLEKPIFEQEVKQAEHIFKLKGYFQGGFSLLKILGLENSLIKQHELSLRETFIEAYNFRSNPKMKAGDMPNTNNNLLKVLCYERYGGIIPENDLGFLCDLGYLFAQTQSNTIKSPIDSNFVKDLIKENETAFKNFTFSQIFYLLDYPKYQKVKEGMKIANFSFATYLLYFKIKAILNEGNKLSETSLPQIVMEFKHTEYKNNLITAVWLAGSFFGYSRFFNEFNQDKSKHEISINNTTKKIDIVEQDQTTNLDKMSTDLASPIEQLPKIDQPKEIIENIVSEEPKPSRKVNIKSKRVRLEITNPEQTNITNLENHKDLFANTDDEQVPKE
jgi:hypothetical protein